MISNAKGETDTEKMRRTHDTRSRKVGIIHSEGGGSEAYDPPRAARPLFHSKVLRTWVRERRGREFSPFWLFAKSDSVGPGPEIDLFVNGTS